MSRRRGTLPNKAPARGRGSSEIRKRNAPLDRPLCWVMKNPPCLIPAGCSCFSLPSGLLWVYVNASPQLNTPKPQLPTYAEATGLLRIFFVRPVYRWRGFRPDWRFDRWPGGLARLQRQAVRGVAGERVAQDHVRHERRIERQGITTAGGVTAKSQRAPSRSRASCESA
jgi:hypothetical protein